MLVKIKKEVSVMNKNDQDFLIQKIRTHYCNLAWGFGIIPFGSTLWQDIIYLLL